MVTLICDLWVQWREQNIVMGQGFAGVTGESLPKIVTLWHEKNPKITTSHWSMYNIEIKTTHEQL